MMRMFIIMHKSPNRRHASVSALPPRQLPLWSQDSSYTFSPVQTQPHTAAAASTSPLGPLLRNKEFFPESSQQPLITFHWLEFSLLFMSKQFLSRRMGKQWLIRITPVAEMGTCEGPISYAKGKHSKRHCNSMSKKREREIAGIQATNDACQKWG